MSPPLVHFHYSAEVTPEKKKYLSTVLQKAKEGDVREGVFIGSTGNKIKGKFLVIEIEEVCPNELNIEEIL